MKLKSSAILVGTYYVTKRGEVRKVVSIQPSGEITFDTHKKLEDGNWSQPRRFHASPPLHLTPKYSESKISPRRYTNFSSLLGGIVHVGGRRGASRCST